MNKINLNFKNRTKLSYTFLRIVAKLTNLDSRTRYYGTNQPLYEAEIHIIKAIKENEGISVTGLAQILGVTKGAISQMLRKLTRKGMIVKDVAPDNLSRLILRLSEKGEIAYTCHEKLHETYELAFQSLLADATEENKLFLKAFLDNLEGWIDREEKNHE